MTIEIDSQEVIDLVAAARGHLVLREKNLEARYRRALEEETKYKAENWYAKFLAFVGIPRTPEECKALALRSTSYPSESLGMQRAIALGRSRLNVMEKLAQRGKTESLTMDDFQMLTCFQDFLIQKAYEFDLEEQRHQETIKHRQQELDLLRRKVDIKERDSYTRRNCNGCKRKSCHSWDHCTDVSGKVIEPEAEKKDVTIQLEPTDLVDLSDKTLLS